MEKWIDIKVRQPREFEECWIFAYDPVEKCYWESHSLYENGRFDCQDDLDAHNLSVTHWIPMKKPPFPEFFQVVISEELAKSGEPCFDCAGTAPDYEQWGEFA